MNTSEERVGCHRAVGARGPVQPITGWPLAEIGQLDEIAPGFLWSAMRRRPAHRQAMFVALACDVLDTPAAFLTRAHGQLDDTAPWSVLLRELANALLTMRPREIVEAALGSCPDGFMGTLERLGFQPVQNREVYLRLHDIFSCERPEARKRRRVIEQIADLDERHLETVFELDLEMLTPTIACRIIGREAAIRLNDQVSLVRRLCSTATSEALIASVEANPQPSRSGWFCRWLNRADRLIPAKLPTDDEPDIERVTPANAKAVGRVYRNCLGVGVMTGRLLSGRWAMVTWNSEQLIFGMTLLDTGGWLVTQVHGPNNNPVGNEKLRKLADRLAGLGVQCFLPAARPYELEIVYDTLEASIFPFEDEFDLGV